MLNPIPIQYLALLAYFILRFGVGIVLLHLGFKVLSERVSIAASLPKAMASVASLTVWALILGKLSIGGLLLLGFYTQYAALALMLMCLDLMLTRRLIHHPILPNRIFYVLMFFAALSLFITGAGAFAIDLPL